MKKKRGLCMAAGGLIEAAAGYAQGGIVRGPGGPEDDKVPMQIAGKDVRLSNTEAVLPARTVQALGGPKAVERLIEVTNGKPPVKGGLREGGRYYLGGILRGAKAAWKMGKSAVDDAAQAAASGADDAARAAARPANQGTMYQGRTRLDGSDVPPPGGPAMPKYEGSGVGQMVDAAKNIGGKVLKGGLALGGIGAAAESGFEAGNDINKVLANEKLGTLDKIGGVAEAAGNAMLSIPTLGLIDKPATKLGELVNGKGNTMLGRAGVNTTPDVETQKPEEQQSVEPATTSPTTPTVAKNETAVQPNKGPGQDASSVTTDPVTKLPVGLAAAAKANDGRANFIAGMDATKYNPAEGTGVITRAPGKDGLRSATFIGGPSAADAARDAKFEAAGYGKDMYGNWMTPQRIALQQAGKEWEERNYSKQFSTQDERNAISAAEAQQKAFAERQSDVARQMEEASKVFGRSKRASAMQAAIEAQRALTAEMGMANSAQQQAAELGLRRQQMDQSVQLAREKAAAEGRPSFRDLIEAQKLQFEKQKYGYERDRDAEAKAREAQAKGVDRVTRMLKESGLPEEQLADFQRQIAAGYFGDLKDKNGKPIAKGLESEDPATQQAAMQQLVAAYLEGKRANRYSTTGSTGKPFEAVGLRDLGWEDLYTPPGSILPEMWDNDPTKMTVAEYAKRKLIPGWLGGRGDQMVVGSDGRAIPADIYAQDTVDQHGNVVVGSLEKRRNLAELERIRKEREAR